MNLSYYVKFKAWGSVQPNKVFFVRLDNTLTLLIAVLWLTGAYRNAQTTMQGLFCSMGKTCIDGTGLLTSVKAVIVEESVRDCQTSSATCHLVQPPILPSPVLFLLWLILLHLHKQQSRPVTFLFKKINKNQSTYKYERNADSFCIVTGQDGANFNHSVIVRLIKVANVSVISQSASFPLSLIAIIYFVYLFSNWPSKCTPWTDWILS